VYWAVIFYFFDFNFSVYLTVFIYIKKKTISKKLRHCLPIYYVYKLQYYVDVCTRTQFAEFSCWSTKNWSIVICGGFIDRYSIIVTRMIIMYRGPRSDAHATRRRQVVSVFTIIFVSSQREHEVTVGGGAAVVRCYSHLPNSICRTNRLLVIHSL
jgi:hypothetical protein